MKLNNKGLATSFVLLIFLLIVLGAYYFMKPYFNKVAEASKQKAFITNARAYISGARNMWTQGDFECQESGDRSAFTVTSEIRPGTYYVLINQYSINVPNITDIVISKYQKSPFIEGQDLHGYIKINFDGSDPKYSIYMFDSEHYINGIDKDINSLTVKDIVYEKLEYVDYGNYDWHFCRVSD